MAIDLLGTSTTPQEDSILAVSRALKDLLAGDLPPSALANLRDALASVSTVVTDLALEFEHHIDLGV